MVHNILNSFHLSSRVKLLSGVVWSVQLNQAIGSIGALAKVSKEYILENTDLSAEKAEVVFRFFRDPKFYLCPNITGQN